jgi:hypothetical protein
MIVPMGVTGRMSAGRVIGGVIGEVIGGVIGAVIGE